MRLVHVWHAFVEDSYLIKVLEASLLQEVHLLVEVLGYSVAILEVPFRSGNQRSNCDNFESFDESFLDESPVDRVQ